MTHFTCLLATLIILIGFLRVAALTNVDSFDGHPLRFLAFSAHWAMLVAGSLLLTFGVQAGGSLLLLGIALGVLADRRRRGA